MLLHPTSLPGDGGLGADAYRFIDFISAAAIKWWQVLPLGPTHEDLSPYNGISAFAGNPGLISFSSVQELYRKEAPVVTFNDSSDVRTKLSECLQAFSHHGRDSCRADFEEFKEKQKYWLEDYALFSNIRRQQQNRSWSCWPKPLRTRQQQALVEARDQLQDEIELSRFEQFLFHDQWLKLRAYAREREIYLIGDMPFFVAYDSAEVWANPGYFDLDEEGYAITVAGVPPDYFSSTGQLWGSPQYDWRAMDGSGFIWWKRRVEHLMACFDLVRIDHFRGLESVWAISASEGTAKNGNWLKVPGRKLLSTLQVDFPSLPFIAEDLGLITEEVESLRDDFGLMGIKVLQFAFHGAADNPYLPHNHRANSVVYTGTHDNDTVIGWFGSLDEHTRLKMMAYLAYPQEQMPWPLLRCALASVSILTVLTMQDLLAMGCESRMNTPGTVDSANWTYRFSWDQVPFDLPTKLAELMRLYGRA